MKKLRNEEKVVKQKKKFSIYEIFNFKNLIIFLISLFVGLVISVVYGIIRAFEFIYVVDGFFLGSCVVIFVGLFDLILNQGTFDVVAVGFSNLYAVTKKNGTKKYDGIYEYAETKRAKRQESRFRFLAIVGAGIVLLIVTFILYLIFNASVQVK